MLIKIVRPRMYKNFNQIEGFVGVTPSPPFGVGWAAPLYCIVTYLFIDIIQ